MQDLYELGRRIDGEDPQAAAGTTFYRVADKLGAAGPKRPVIFECVGRAA